MSETLNQMQVPSNDKRPWPFFILNDEFLPEQGEARLTEFLENLNRVGFGGVFIHPRPGLMTEYLGPRWFELVRHIIAECRRLKLEVALYDENSYPSGFSGGHVPALVPDTVVRAVTPLFGTGRVDLPMSPVSLYRWNGASPAELLDSEDVTEDDSWVAFVDKPMEPSAWHGGFTYVSLLDPQVVPAFLETTHERYREELSEEEWGCLRAMFTDEPHLPAESHGSWSAGLHMTNWVNARFKQRCGYDLSERLAELYWDLPESPAVRFDYYETLHSLFVEHWAEPVGTWCEENRLPLTGHYLEHDWPCPYATPGHMHLFKYMQWPGTDLLETFLLEGHQGGDPQNLTATPAGREAQALYFLRQAHSVANQFGKERVSCESWGAGGNDSSPADWLRIGRFLVAHGVNLLVPHHAPVTIRGSRKTDHPQFFSEMTACFDSLRPMNDEFGRLCEWTTRGKMENRILLVDPVTTGFCLARKSDCIGMERKYDESLRPDFVERTQRSIQPLRSAATELAQAFSEACADFDIGDEYIIEEDAQIEGAQFTIGHQSYQVVVLPPRMENLREATLEKLESFLKSGGALFAVRPLNGLVNGRPVDWSARLDAAGSVCWVEEEADLCPTVLGKVPPRVSVSSPFPVGFAHQRRADGNTVIYLFVNSGPETWSGSLDVPESGRRTWMDPSTGEQEEVGADQPLIIPSCEARIMTVDPDSLSGEPGEHETVPFNKPCSVELEAVNREALNAWVIDTCSAEINGEQFEEELVYSANRRYWDASGLGTNGWHMVIQYRDQMFRRAKELSPDLRAAFTYRLNVAEDMDMNCWQLAVETPELWTVSVNGTVVDFLESSSWRDLHIRSVQVGSLLHKGINEVTLSSDAFDVRQEIDQIYLFGDFSLQPSGNGFCAVRRQTPMTLGSWKEQGCPFYDDQTTYKLKTERCESVRINIPANAWAGSVLLIHTSEEQRICYGPEIDEVVVVGSNGRVALTVVGLPLNVFGPFRVSDPRPKRAWSVQWSGPDVPAEPLPGDRYRLLDFGLFRMPEFFHGYEE